MSMKHVCTKGLTWPPRRQLKNVARHPPPLLDKRRGARRGAGVSGTLQKPGNKPGAPILVLRGKHRGPIHAGGLELPRPHVVPKGRLTHAVENQR